MARNQDATFGVKWKQMAEAAKPEAESCRLGRSAKY